jgi:ferredoxin
MSETMQGQKVIVDTERCQGHARCLLDAPDVFGYDDVTNNASVRPDADIEGNRALIDLAIAGCPEAAISWVGGAR